ncbi:MAG: hypothetical protein P8177_11925 [Gemmatimonadota bacterium]
MLGDLFHRLGSVVGRLEAQVQGAGGREVAVYDTSRGEGFEAGQDVEQAGNVIMAAIGGWVLSRIFRPAAVSWPRVVVAGVAATLAADLAGRLEDDAPEPGREPHARDAEELLGRVVAGVALAAGYASLLYPRLPGPPLLRGLAFGALEVAAAPRGGLVNMAANAPGIRFPLQAAALPVDEDAGLLSHLAFSLTLGLLYRYGRDEDDDS